MSICFTTGIDFDAMSAIRKQSIWQSENNQFGELLKPYGLACWRLLPIYTTSVYSMTSTAEAWKRA